MCDVMMFPDTAEEFMEQYKIVDTEQVYTNGAELIPIFRMKQWLEHLQDIEPRWIPCEESLPQSRTACFVTTECGGERNTCISVFDCGTGWSNLEYGERVISWINLPDPWGGERDGSD